MYNDETHYRCLYYKHYFPYDTVVNRLAGMHTHPKNVEFALEGEWYTRYKSAPDGPALRNIVMTETKNLLVIHIGGAYSNGVSKRGNTEAAIQNGTISKPCGSALRFDLDLDDAPFLKLNKHDLLACDRAWPVAAVGIFLLKFVVAERFGFDDFLVFYSGRRGMHLWCLDHRAFVLDNAMRDAIANAVNFEPDNRCPLRASSAFVRDNVDRYQLWDVVRALFFDIFLDPEGLDLFGIETQIHDFVKALELSHPGLQGLASEAACRATGRDAFEFIERKIEGCTSYKTVRFFQERLQAVVCGYVWPRIDFNVTKDTAHLIKCPYSPHASTGRLCVPVPMEEGFFSQDPSEFPTAKQIVEDREARAAFQTTLTDIEKFVSHSHFHEEVCASRREAAMEVEIEDVVSDSSRQKRPLETPVEKPSEALMTQMCKLQKKQDDFVLPNDQWVLRLNRLFFVEFDAESKSVNVDVEWVQTEEGDPVLTHTTAGEFRLRNGNAARFRRKDGTDFVSTAMNVIAKAIQGHPNEDHVWMDRDVRILKPLQRYKTYDDAMKWARTFAQSQERHTLLTIDVDALTPEALATTLDRFYHQRGRRVSVL